MTRTTFDIATIRARKLADGTVSYTAQIRIKRDGVQVYQESQTFARKQAAQAWARKRESELDEPGAIERANRNGVTAKEMIEQYLLEVEKARPLGKTKKATLEAIGRMDIGKLNDTDINTQCLVDFGLWRMSREGGGVQPQTAGNAWRTSVPFWRLPKMPGAIKSIRSPWAVPGWCRLLKGRSPVLLRMKSQLVVPASGPMSTICKSTAPKSVGR